MSQRANAQTAQCPNCQISRMANVTIGKCPYMLNVQTAKCHNWQMSLHAKCSNCQMSSYFTAQKSYGGVSTCMWFDLHQCITHLVQLLHLQCNTFSTAQLVQHNQCNISTNSLVQMYLVFYVKQSSYSPKGEMTVSLSISEKEKKSEVLTSTHCEHPQR